MNDHGPVVLAPYLRYLMHADDLAETKVQSRNQA